MKKYGLSLLILFCLLITSLSAQTFSWTKIDTTANRRCLNLTTIHDGSVLAGTDSGLYRSFDNGITWQKCGLDSFEINCATADSTGRLFVIGGYKYRPNGIYRSEDGGISWQKSVVIFDTSSSNSNYVYSVSVILPVTNEILLAASDAGILRSTDHGDSWNIIYKPSSSLSEQGIYSFCITQKGTIYAGTMSNILRSTDQGNSWKVSIQIGSGNYTLASGNFGDVFTFSMARNGHAYLYRTIDQGNNWAQFYPELFEAGVSFVLENGIWVQYGPGSYGLLGITKDSYDRSFIICSNKKDSIFVMSTNGKILQSLAVENVNSFSAPIAMAADGHLLICMGDIYRSVNAIVPPAIPSIKISQAIVDTDHDSKPDSVGKTVTIVGVINSANFQGNEGTQYTLQDGTGGIQLFKNGSGGPMLKLGDAIVVTGTIAQERGTTQIIPTSFSDNVFNIIDSNQVITQTVLTLPQFLADPEKYENQLVKITGIAKHPNSIAWPTSGNDATIKFWDGWENDTVIVRIDKDANFSGTPEPAYPANVQAVVTQFTSSQSVYNDGYQLSPSNPTDFTSGIQVPPNPHFALVTPANSITWIIDSTSQQFKFTWNKPIDLNGDPLAYRWVPVGGTAVATGGSPSGSDSFLVRTGQQLRALQNNKDTTILKWTVQTKDQYPTIVTCVDTFSVVLIKGKTLGVEITDDALPTVFSLAQNYPNPFNPTTTINYALPKSGNVVLKVYDVLGKEVVTLVNGYKEIGYYTVQFDASRLSSGMYIYKLTSDKFTEVKKMILLR